MAVAALVRSQLRRQLHLRAFSSSSASSILNPSDPSAVLTSKQKSRAALRLLKSETNPSRIVDICRAASLCPSASHLDRLALSDAISALAKSQSFTEVHSILDSLPPASLPHAIVLFGQAGLHDDAIRAFEKSPSVRTLNALLFACIVSRRHEEVSRIFSDFPGAHGITPNIETYNNVIKAFSESGTTRSFYSVLDQMCTAGVKPDTTTFCNALDGFYREKRFDEVDKVLELMKKHDCDHGLGIYNLRIQSLCKLKRTNEAKELFKEMKKKGPKPTWITYNHLIFGFCNEGQLEDAKKLYQEMKGGGHVPISKCHFTLIHFLCRGGDFEAALSVCKDSMAHNWIPNFSTMKMLVKGLIGSSKVEEARDIMEKVKEKFPGNADMWKEVEEAFPK
ncbi:pentatricopeptide repeat-containing protein At1g11630, mitochondrial-like [Curcuma longa]|uniref:pentatricopeptide repeat-containing protein At1g11630, mitochondrial-like n=1 Tax=Curcuma longa TaxID=136217 RepID=UPI003D9E8D58